MIDIEFEKNGMKKITQERFKDDLIAEGWSVVGEDAAEEKPKKKGRPPKKVAEDDNS